jgi:glucosamine-phosphate N-acetyltransferase
MWIRKLAFHDKDQYLSLLKELTDIGQYDDYKWRQVWNELTSHNNIEIYVIEDDPNGDLLQQGNDQPVPVSLELIAAGTIIMEQKFIHGGALVGHIEDIVVKKTARSAGLGKRMVNFLTEHAKHLGAYKVILDCKESVVPFYEKCGFVKQEVQMRCNL